MHLIGKLSNLNQVSKLLEKELGTAYRPEVHWTSYFRGRSGLDPFTGNAREVSTFTLNDAAVSAAFAQLLIRHGYKKASTWKSPTFHVEVCTTEEDILSTFTLEPYQIQKVGPPSFADIDNV